MGLMQQVEADLVKAMKAQEKVRTGALRMLKSALKNAQIEAGTLDDAAASQVVMKLCKQRKESIEQYKAANRQDLVDAEAAELKLLEQYLPAQMSKEQVEKIVAEVIAAVGATTVKEMGAVMKEVQARTSGTADNKLVSELIKAKLAK